MGLNWLLLYGPLRHLSCLGAVEWNDLREPGPADGAGVSPLDEHLAAAGAGAQVVAGRQDAAARPVHADDALAVEGRLVPVYTVDKNALLLWLITSSANFLKSLHCCTFSFPTSHALGRLSC